MRQLVLRIAAAFFLQRLLLAPCVRTLPRPDLTSSRGFVSGTRIEIDETATLGSPEGTKVEPGEREEMHSIDSYSKRLPARTLGR